MTGLAEPRWHTDAVIAMLTAELEPAVLVGDGERPTGAGWSATPGQSSFTGYVIVYPIGQAFDGSVAEPDVDATLMWQVTCVGATRQHAETVLGLVNAALIGRTVDTAGRTTTGGMRAVADAGGVRRDEAETQPPLWIATPRYMATSTPT
jgi:hypothetical protein